MSNQPDYPFLRLWHHDSGSGPAYIHALVHQAEAEGAPQDALYPAHNGHGWRTMRDLEDSNPQLAASMYRRYIDQREGQGHG